MRCAAKEDSRKQNRTISLTSCKYGDDVNFWQEETCEHWLYFLVHQLRLNFMWRRQRPSVKLTLEMLRNLSSRKFITHMTLGRARDVSSQRRQDEHSQSTVLTFNQWTVSFKTWNSFSQLCYKYFTMSCSRNIWRRTTMKCRGEEFLTHTIHQCKSSRSLNFQIDTPPCHDKPRIGLSAHIQSGYDKGYFVATRDSTVCTEKRPFQYYAICLHINVNLMIQTKFSSRMRIYRRKFWRIIK